MRLEIVIFYAAGQPGWAGRCLVSSQVDAQHRYVTCLMISRELAGSAWCDLGQSDVITRHGWGVGARLRVDLRAPHSAACLTLS